MTSPFRGASHEADRSFILWVTGIDIRGTKRMMNEVQEAECRMDV